MSRSGWRLLLDGARPGWQNMAIDRALLDLAAGEDAAFLRLYRWEPHCLSFGRHEPALRRYDRERIAALQLDCVRRPTGGRAVWHARELTYAVAAPLARFGGMQAAYQRIHQMLAEGLRRLGAAPELALRREAYPLPVGAGPCFSAPVGGEVLVARRKVVGSAQVRQGEALLQHGSLLLEDDQAMVRDLAGLSGATEAEISLASALGRPVSFAAAAAALVDSARAELDPELVAEELPPAVLERAETHSGRFRDPAWTWQR